MVGGVDAEISPSSLHHQTHIHHPVTSLISHCRQPHDPLFPLMLPFGNMSPDRRPIQLLICTEPKVGFFGSGFTDVTSAFC